MHEVDDFAVFRQADVFFHLGLAEAAGSSRLVAAMTEVQGAMSELIGHIAHPPEVLERSNAQHAKLVALLAQRDAARAARLIREHLHGHRERARRPHALTIIAFYPRRVSPSSRMRAWGVAVSSGHLVLGLAGWLALGIPPWFFGGCAVLTLGSRCSPPR